jgi:hypothetical protein
MVRSRDWTGLLRLCSTRAVIGGESRREHRRAKPAQLWTVQARCLRGTRNRGSSKRGQSSLFTRERVWSATAATVCGHRIENAARRRILCLHTGPTKAIPLPAGCRVFFQCSSRTSRSFQSSAAIISRTRRGFHTVTLRSGPNFLLPTRANPLQPIPRPRVFLSNGKFSPEP